MLISVKPEALVFGKLLGIVSAGLLQLFIWIVSIAVGFFAGFAILESRGSGLPIQAFFKMMSELGLFSVPKIILAVITIIFGILLYCSLSCFAGSISKNREEAASNNTIFMMVLLASFYIVFFFGLSSAGEGLPLWMMFVPPVAAMVLPAALCLGTISFGAGALAVALLVGIAIAVTIISGRLYKMMSLYKGNNVKIGKALKMLFSGQG
jgi:ABC-type Na+ efflux pump permease subunit